MPSSNERIPERKRRSRVSPVLLAALVAAYVAVVLLVDSLASMGISWPFSWSTLHWDVASAFPAFQRTIWGSFDLFKFTFWLAVPLVVALPGMDWRYFLFGRWKRLDLWVVGGLAVLGMAVMFIIPFVPALHAIYPGLGTLSAGQKWMRFLYMMVWNLSWLPGWEFLHRYFLLKAVQREALDRGRFLPGWRWAQWAWLLVPVSETLYHLQKPGLEAVGMFAFSVVLTFWCLKRRNWLFGFLLHLTIEVELLVFMTITS